MSLLFNEIMIGGLRIENRLVRSATYEKRADDDGFVTPHLIELYEELVRGGVGLIITGNALVHPSGRSVEQMLCLHSDNYVSGLRELTDAVHDLGGVIGVQLVHGGRQSPPLLLGGDAPVAPSPVYEPTFRTTPRELTDAEIWTLIDSFGDAAARARRAGFDCVQVHAAHGYLVSQFLSPYTNQRTDYWGGDEERRFHFLEETMKIVRKAVGENYPLLIKINSRDFIDGGLGPEAAARACWRLEDMKCLDAVEVSAGMISSNPKPIRPGIDSPEKEAYLRADSAIFRQRLRIPVILTGGLRSRDVMEEVLENGEADLIGLSRPLIREPDLPLKLREGTATAAADCTSCNQCIRYRKLEYVRCPELDKK